VIRYTHRWADIERLVNDRKPRWQKRAADRTAVFARHGDYVTSEIVGEKEKKLPDFWGEVKSVFLNVQYGKCAYCEMPLEVGRGAEIQWDLEHFRPKSSVRAWPAASPGMYFTKSGVTISTGQPMAIGYYLLAYHLRNFVAACKTCNTICKRDYFPIAATRVESGAVLDEYAAERPFLIYPIGRDAEDAEEFICFDGVVASPRNGSVRGEIVIAFFDLNRDGLQAARARWLRHTVWPNVLLTLQGNADATASLERLLSAKAPLTNCTRCFVELCEQDFGRAAGLIPSLDEMVELFPQMQLI
jgi:5-methylcytosine-specific restriction endonuclease McrA